LGLVRKPYLTFAAVQLSQSLKLFSYSMGDKPIKFSQHCSKEYYQNVVYQRASDIRLI
jgi:hypothetical protein